MCCIFSPRLKKNAPTKLFSFSTKCMSKAKKFVDFFSAVIATFNEMPCYANITYNLPKYDDYDSFECGEKCLLSY